MVCFVSKLDKLLHGPGRNDDYSTCPTRNLSIDIIVCRLVDKRGLVGLSLSIPVTDNFALLLKEM
jgi:hypothetical protein